MAGSGTEAQSPEPLQPNQFWVWLSRVLQNVAGALIIGSVIGTGTLGVRTWLAYLDLRHDVDVLKDWKDEGGRFTEKRGTEHWLRMDRVEAISTETLKRMHRHEITAEKHIGTIHGNEERSHKNETRIEDLIERVYLKP